MFSSCKECLRFFAMRTFSFLSDKVKFERKEIHSKLDLNESLKLKNWQKTYLNDTPNTEYNATRWQFGSATSKTETHFQLKCFSFDCCKKLRKSLPFYIDHWFILFLQKTALFGDSIDSWIECIKHLLKVKEKKTDVIWASFFLSIF